ncbi:ABC transporter substrate-binding protein [Aidingimonas lacisalsi]|uniref:ABC transporter substrate-binding protein n=1 Tax=Aidingimonas lacisalsi TaxID=2604086 RepID=UPI0011D20E8C|nr:ABC transporter substrate-binding protein [Aidingimonas lacisalsi]
MPSSNRAATVMTLTLVSVLGVSTAHGQELTVYSSGPGELANNLVSGFEEETGVDVNLFQSTTGDVMSRLEAERVNPQADVIISASWDSAADLEAEGRLLDYTSSNAESVPDFLVNDTYTAQGVAALSLAYNTQSDVPRPSEWEDLRDPVYTDQVSMPDPAQSGSAYDFVAGLVSDRGEDAWALLDVLADQGLIVPGANRAALNPVLQGGRSVVFGAVDYIALGQAARGESVEVIHPDSGTVIAPRPIMIQADTDQPDQAKSFVDFVLSETGQRMVADVFLMPARADIPADRATIDELTVIETKDDVAADREALLGRFKEVTEGR